jgi:hypothetical protein
MRLAAALAGAGFTDEPVLTPLAEMEARLDMSNEEARHAHSTSG